MDHELKQTALVHIDPIGMCSVTYGMEKKGRRRGRRMQFHAIGNSEERIWPDLYTHTIQWCLINDALMIHDHRFVCVLGGLGVQAMDGKMSGFMKGRVRIRICVVLYYCILGTFILLRHGVG